MAPGKRVPVMAFLSAEAAQAQESHSHEEGHIALFAKGMGLLKNNAITVREAAIENVVHAMAQKLYASHVA